MNKYIENPTDKIEQLTRLLGELKKNSFTGVIRINYSQGGITRIEKNEEIPIKIKQAR